MAAVRAPKENWYEAEINRVAGEIALLGAKPDAAKAETCFANALEIARKQKAKSWELRAAMSMARLLQTQSRKRAARDALAPVYGWFTQGFDTLDLRQAKLCARRIGARPANESNAELMNRDAFWDAAHRVDDVSAGDALKPMQVVGPAQGNPLGGSEDLVARALAILDQDKMKADARSSRRANIASEPAPRSVGPGPAPAIDLQLQRRVLSDGAECFLPIRYFDVQCLVASFLVAPERASELLGGAGLQPVVAGGRKSGRRSLSASSIARPTSAPIMKSD